jgi:bleomycin hydrolase
MKKVFLLALAGFFCFQLSAQTKKTEPEKKEIEYKFTVEKELPYTSIKNQASSSTCWSFSGLAMIESELLRIGKDTVDLSEMWVVRNTYMGKVEKYVRMHGSLELSGGGSFEDVLYVCENYGMVPEEAYRGLEYGTEMHSHGELDRIISEFGKSIVKSRTPTIAWKRALSAILDAYLGPAPEKFMYKGVEYTPKSFAKSLGLNFDDYVSITSYTHHPFYKHFILEIPDNWAFASSWNVPLNEFMSIFDYAINAGYTIAWGSDVSERSFSRDMATWPEEKKGEIVGTDQARWTGQRTKEEKVELEKEKVVTQESRQEDFDNYKTTDDHGMQIIGIVKDQFGRKYYKVKNSWGIGGKYVGLLYVTEAFVKAKTMNILVNKNAIPPAVRQKLNL